MKRFLSLLLFLFIFFPAAAADPLSATEDYAEDITVYYNGTDDSDGRYLYSYRYPRVSDEDPGDLSAICVNEFYRKKIQEYKSDYIPSLADYYGSIRRSVTVKIRYEITCNNDEFFSVLIRRTEDDGEEISESWEGNTFSRSSDMIGSLTSVPHLLGILDYGESDEWLEDRQSRKAADALCTLILEAIQNDHGDIDYYPDLGKEDLEGIIDPVFSLDHDFWMDEAGNLVFFILPGRIAPADAGLITFTFTLEELRDEL